MNVLRAIVLVAVVVCSSGVRGQPALTPTPFVSGLAAPVEIAHANDGSGRLFIVEQQGRIRIVTNGVLQGAPFLDISAASGGPVRAGGEAGLLGLAFHPSYITTGIFFVYYTRALAGDSNGVEIVVARYLRSDSSPDSANPSSGTVMLTIPHPQFSNHNGGKLAFGPDGFLYVAVGDGGGGGDPFNAAQSLGDLRGKILRIDVDGAGAYAIPRYNPFVARIGARGEIWGYGLRNPWRFSFDRLTGDIYIGDVGQNSYEEIDFERRGTQGRNYGWPIFEGGACMRAPCTVPDHSPPVWFYSHGANGFSVTGGYAYRGTSMAGLAGYYVFGDFGSGRIWAGGIQGPGWFATQVASVPNLSTFGEDEVGELYAANYGTGQIFRLTPASNPPTTGTRTPRYRLYSPQSYEHLFTTDANEYATLPVCCGWIQEGAPYEVFIGPASVGGVASVPYYRLYHPGGGQHHWTTDANEYATLPQFGWQQEGIDGHILPRQAPGAIPLYRLYHPYGFHHWTTDAHERHVITHSYGWIDEGIAGYVMPRS